MRYFKLTVWLLVCSLLGNAQQKPPAKTQSESAASPKGAQTTEPTPANTSDGGPAVDSAKVNSSTFTSDFFKFTYELPKDWKALDDAERVAENQKLLKQDQAAISGRPAPKKKGAPSKTQAQAPSKTMPASNSGSTERYSLLAASSEKVESLQSEVLPRINIWAHRKFPSQDSISDHAQYLAATKRAQILEKPREVSVGGHTFMRIDILAPGGEYHSQWVTMVGDYLVGFEFLTASETELNRLVTTMDSVKFQ